jgi:chromosome segregation ATPase
VQEPLKGSDLREMRHNAVRLFVTWLGVNRNLNSEELSSLLFQVVWQPAAKDLADDNARLRALTDIGQAAGVGLACQRFRQQAIEVRTQQDQVQREATSLRDRLSAAETQLADTAAELEAVRGELKALLDSSSAEVETLRRQHTVDRTHLQHDLGQLRGRLVKRLTDSVEMLEVGLSALRKDTPRVPVMVERAEHVVDALRAEIKELREE